MKKHKITIKPLHKGLELFENYRALLKSAGVLMLEELGADLPCEVEVLFTSEEEMRALNRDLRDIDCATDVLSFPMCDLTPEDRLSLAVPDWERKDGRVYLGDIVICVPRARAQAYEYSHSLERETAFLITHSILHLLGYSHPEGGEPDSEATEKQEAVLKRLGLERI